MWASIACSLSSFVNEGGMVPETAVWSSSIVSRSPLKFSLEKREFEMVPDSFQFWSIERTWVIGRVWSYGSDRGRSSRYRAESSLPRLLMCMTVCNHI